MAENPYAAPSSNVTGGDSYGSANDIATSTINILRMTKGWARFLSVLAYIGGSSLVILVVFGFANFEEVARQFGGSGFGPGAAEALRAANQMTAVVLIVYLVGAVIGYFIPAIILGGYASRIGNLIANPSTITLDMALDKQRSFFKYVGVLAVIFLSLFVLVTLFLIAKN